MTMMQERFTRDVEAIWAGATGLGEDMLEPAVGGEVAQLATQVEQTDDKPKVEIKIGPLFAILGIALVAALLVSGTPRRRFRKLKK